MNFMTFHRLGISSAQLTSTLFRGVAQPPTRYSVRHSHRRYYGNYVLFGEKGIFEDMFFVGYNDDILCIILLIIYG